MGTGVSSACLVFISQGLLVLSSLLQEHLQEHRLWLGLGLQLGNLKDKTKSLPRLQASGVPQLHQSSQVAPKSWLRASPLVAYANNFFLKYYPQGDSI